MSRAPFAAALPLLLFVAAPPASAALTAPQSGAADLGELIDTQARRANDDPSDRIWQCALALRQASDVLGSDELDAMLDARLEATGAQPTNATLLLVAARLSGTEPDLEALSNRLLDLVDGADTPLATEALELFARPVFRGLPRESRIGFGAQLLERAQDAGRTPEVRIAAALAAHALGGGAEKRQARSELLDFLASADPSTRGLAALALAETGEGVEGDLEDVLRELEGLPGDAAGLASAYLKLESSKRLRDRKLRELQERFDENVLPADLARLQAVLRMVEERHLEGELYERDELVDLALDGLLRSLDEHSTYMTPRIFGDFQQDLDAEYGGIGAYVGIDPADNLFTITRPIYSGPAYRAGLATDDKIVRIDDWPTLGETSDDIIKRLKGKPGTDVVLYVWRRGMDPEQIDRPTDDMAIEVTRELIEIPAAHYQLLPGGVGLIELTTFSRVAANELARAIQDMSEEGLTGVILDLRRNSGGLLTEAVRVADLFLDKNQVVVRTEYRGEPTQELRTQYPAVIPEDLPVAILTSRFTASASEIVSGALKDHGRATLVGERTFGKGSVQNLLPVGGTFDDRFEDENDNGRFDTWERITYDFDGDGEFDFAPRVKLTIARYLLPSGRSIHRELDKDGSLLSEGGVRPDVEVSMPRLDAWRWEERLKLTREEQAPKRYVDEHWDAHHELFVELAETDLKDTTRWPDFDAFYASLGTPLSTDDVRQLLRAEVRRRVQDDRGGEFPLGDFQEDPQVQAAIRELLAKTGRSSEQYEPYRTTFVEPSPEERRSRALASRDTDELRDAVERVRSAGDAIGTIAPEDIQALLDALGYTDG